MTRQLFPSLPAEIRNAIYAQTVDPCQPKTLRGLPFSGLKTYQDKHTTVQIIPGHRGNASLLSLKPYGFIEAHEYQGWLQQSGIEMQIGIHIHGDLKSFIQEHWDKKMEKHLHILAKKWPWLTKVPTYKVQILWDPKDWPKKQRRNTMGNTVEHMIKVSTGLLDPTVGINRGDVEATLNIGRKYALGHQFLTGHHCLVAYLKPKIKDVQRCTRRVKYLVDRVGADDARSGGELPLQFKALHNPVSPKDVEMLSVSQNGDVDLGSFSKGAPICERVFETGRGLIGRRDYSEPVMAYGKAIWLECVKQ